MTRYHPSLRLNRRRRLVSDDRPEVARVTALGVFIILIAFFVGLVAWSSPSEDRTVDLISTLQSTFRPPDTAPLSLSAPPTIPAWLAGGTPDNPSPLSEAQRLFPGAFPKQTGDNAGMVEMRFAPDGLQAFLLGQPDLAQNLVAGLGNPRTPRGGGDEYIMQITVGTKGRNANAARILLVRTRKTMLDLGIHPTRLLAGYEAGADVITIRLVQAERFGGTL